MIRISPRALVGAVVLTVVTVVCVGRASAAPIVLNADGAKTLDNLRVLALAAHNYESVYGRFPSDYVDGGGTAILSWRVALLPFVGEAALFGQFDTTRPWNDAVNLPALAMMPDVFRSPGSAAGSTQTDYAGAAGPGTMFPGGPGPRIADVADGTSNTILFGEAIGSAIPWTQPGDIAIGSCPSLGGSGFSSVIPGAVPFAFVDGDVGLFSTGVDCGTLLPFLLRDDGSVIDRSALLPFVAGSVPEPPLPLLMLSVAAVAVWRRVA